MTADEELLDQIAETLWLSGRLVFDGDRYKAADALLPVVRRHAEQRAAAELRALVVRAYEQNGGFLFGTACYLVADAQARADALAATDTD